LQYLITAAVLLRSFADLQFTAASWMRPPRRRVKQLHLLRHHKRSKLRRKAFDEIPIREHCGPMCPTIDIILEFPQMHELIYDPCIPLEVPDEVLVVPAFLQRRKAELLIELHRFRHFANVQCVGSQFVERHGDFSLISPSSIDRFGQPAVPPILTWL
jgi:hypothetical protein